MSQYNEPLNTCFISLDVPDHIVDFAVNIQRKLNRKSNQQVDWVDPEKLHITLQFLGRITPTQQSMAHNTLRKLIAQTRTFDLTVGHVDYFYQKHGRGALWLAVYDKEKQLDALHRELTAQLNLKDFSLTTKKLVPHLTIGRLKKMKNDQKKQLLSDLAEYEVQEYVPFTAEQISLRKSNLRELENSTSYTTLHTYSMY